jgi:hypothetical protein
VRSTEGPAGRAPRRPKQAIHALVFRLRQALAGLDDHPFVPPLSRQLEENRFVHRP